MYAEHYKLSGKPFQLSPDHRFFFGSRSHNKAMAYLSFGLNEREGFIVITGEVGAGKTTLVGHLMSEIDREKFVSANVVTTQLEADDALRMVASAFGLKFEGRAKAALLREIESFLTENHELGKHVVLVVDEAQNMSMSAIEELRMLSNFQADGKPLLQCFLLGQPQFRAIMARPEMEQLRQRVIASCHIEPLEEDETRAYIEHRLGMVGWDGDPSFTDKAFQLIHLHAGGVPRRINTLCGRLLLFGSLEDLHEFDAATVKEVVEELSDEGTQFSSLEQPRASPAIGLPSAPLPSLPLPNAAPPAAPAAPFVSVPWRETESYGDALGILENRVQVLKRGAAP